MLVFEHCEALVCGERDIHGIARMVGGGGLIGGDKAAWSAKGRFQLILHAFLGVLCGFRVAMCRCIWPQEEPGCLGQLRCQRGASQGMLASY